MANKKKKNQDTSPLALGRQQKGSAANKKANKAGSSNGSQPSSSNYSSRTSSSSRSSSNQRSANTAANNDLKQNQIQRSQQQNRQLINRITESSNARRTAAQRQKITAGIDNSTNARKEREQRRLQAQAQKSGTNAINRPSEETRRASRRALKNTPKLVSKAVKDTISGHGQTIADVTELTAEKGTNAYAMKTGLSEKIAEADRKRAATEARKERKKMQAAQEARQAEWDELTKAAKGFEKAYYGAVESGTGMLTDLAIGGGTQLGALAAMGSRTYGQTRGQAEKEGATQSEDRRYALLQAAKEVGTELMFPGAGLAKKTYGKVGLPFAETLANAATKNLSGTAANVTRAGLKLAGGVAEENAEEFGGWLLDPLIKEYTYGKNVRERRRSELQRESDEWRSNILNDDDARSAAAYLNSSFIADNKKIYMDNGMSEGEAQKLAEAMRDYFTASLTGDTKKMEEIEDKLVGKGLSKKDWSLGELAETLAATTLLTGATGLPGTVMSSAQGAAFKGELGENGIKALAKTAKDFEDKEMSLKAEVMADRIESGKEITDTEAYELKQGLAKQLQKDSQRETASVNSAMVKIQSQDLVSPLQSNANGEVLRGEVTEKAFKEENTKAKGAIKDVLKDNKESLTTKEINTGSRAIADFKVGTFDVNDANALNYSNKAVRTAFEESTGIDLEQYVVKNKDGSVNIPATNAATKDALFAMAADNLVKSAQAETVYWMDTAKGEVVTQVSARMGASGSEALQQALDDVDERDRSAYMMTANATDMLYQAARNMGIEWKDVASEATKMFPGIPESKLKMMYDAGLDDRKMAMDKARGRSVEMGKKLSEMSEKETATGKVFIDTNKPPLGTVIRTFTEIAKNLGADIHLTDAIKNVDGDAIDGANGAYDPDTNTFYLNLNTGMEKNIGYIFMHEVTHYIKRNAPEEYLALENLVREKWFQFNPEQMQDAIARKIEAYKKATKGKQVLTEEQALEEIIADAAHEFINDPNFAKQIADEDTGLAKAVLNSIRNALRMLRRIFASGSIDEETHMNSLFSELGILDEAEKIWLNAYTQAVKMRADQAINDWQDAVNESDVRFSIPEYTQEEMDAHRQYLIDSSAESYENPYTNDLNESGFIFPDGSLPRMGEYGQRADDHNLVIGAYDDIGYDTSQHPKADAMARFLNEGNIRYMPENGSIELGTEAEPTYEQYERIREMDYVNMIEFTAPDGSTADYKEYDGDRSGVVNDIKRFYRDGEIGGSELGQFRYSISDAEREALNTDGVDVTESGSAVRYSFASWSDTDKEDLLEKLVSAGYDRAAAERWIDDVNSISAIIYGDMARLNYEADSYQDALKPNSEYFYTLDLSTLCQKRRLYQGNYNAIMRHLVNKALHPEDTVRLREMMEEMGLETPCGICYEESRKKNEGKFAETWLNGETDAQWRTREKAYQKNLEKYHQKLDEYNALEDKGKKKAPNEPKKPERWMGYKNMEHDDPYIPTLADVTTTDGRAELRKNHPESLEAYLEYQKGRGSANPKVSFTHTDYRRDILRMTKTDVANVKHIGGLRMQSFSDFESIHVIDVMQAIMDMATLKLTSQAYTKVPAFADIFGDTGVKINLSLIQKMDENGNPVYDEDGRLVFDSKEGIDPEEAFRIRDKYSKNVGTILVGVNDKQILDAWADDRVDMVIPFHRSGWSIKEFERLGLKGYEDYQDYQSERILDPKTGQWLSFSDAKKKGLTFPDGTLEELYSVDYWDSSKTGKENAEEYLKLCAEQHRRPVFYNFLHDNGDGTWSLPTEEVDGYTADGYWKSLIDYKMYDNEGAFAPQEEVKPVFDMDAAEKTLSEYEGDADTLPVNTDLVEAYLKDYKKRHPRAKIDFDGDVRLSIAVDMDEPYMSAVNSGNMEEAQKLVEEAAKSAGFVIKGWHGTDAQFNRFDAQYIGSDNKLGKGFYFSKNGLRFDYPTEIVAWIKIKNPITDNSRDISDEEWDLFCKTIGIGNVYGINDIDRYTKASDIYKGDNDFYLIEFIKITGKDGVISDDRNSVVVFSPASVKSADTITYAEDGSVIPLSERFNPDNNDIRYSLPTQDSDDNILSDGQMEYFKNSQARDEQGKLLVLYHGTDQAGFTIFNTVWESGAARLIWMTTSRRDADAYGGNWEHKLFDANEKETKEAVTAENYTLAGINPSYAYMRFDNESDKKQFIEDHPDITNAHDYWTLDDMLYNDEIDEREFNRLREADKKILSDYSKYEEKHSMVSTWGDVFDNPERFEKRDLARALLAYDREAAIDEEEEDTKETLLEVMQSIEAEHVAEGESLRDLSFKSRIPIGETQEYVHKVNNRTYELYANLENPLVIDMRGRHMADGGYAYIDEMSANDEYDGIVLYNTAVGRYADPQTVVVAKASNQVKDVNNTDPTENPDIRWSITSDDEIKDSVMQRAENIDDIPLADPALEENRVKSIAAERDFINSISASWDRRTLNLDKKFNKTPMRNKLIRLMRQAKKGTGRQYKTETLNETVKSVQSMYKSAKANNAQAFAKEAWNAAERIVSDIDYNDDMYEQYKWISSYFSNTDLHIPEELIDDEDFVRFVRDNAGRIRLFPDKGIEIEDAWKALHKKYPDLFIGAKTVVDSPIGMLTQMKWVLDQMEPYKEAYTSEEHTKIVEDIANNLCDIISEGKEFQATISELNVQAMKQRHEEALRKVREERNAITEAERQRANMWKERYNERIQKEKQDKTERREREDHKKKFARIEEKYNNLCKWVLEPTKDKNVPEEFRKSLAEFLQTLDLQTEKSKALEEKTGHVALKTFKMRELKDRLKALATSKTDAEGNYTPSLFEVDENVAFILDKLADKLEKNGNTIDALDQNDIDSIDVFMTLLIRNINRYKEVRKEEKTAELSAVRDECMDFFEAKIKRDGMATKRGGPLGALDTINATALTPPYLFERMGPFKEMYDVLRHNGFDTYIRNEAMIIDKITDILRPYYKGGKKPRPGSVIEDWRDDTMAKTFNLTHGPVTLSVAQMMSLYCLDKRGTQATDHMTCGGIYVTPIQVGSKIQAAKEKYIKGRNETPERLVLTPEDIKTILAELTPEQVKVASALQQLMSEDMARLGNIAHRDLYGYNNFNDPNYFPIKVHGNELSTDINNIGQVVEKIKSYGPAKPVTPGASNALVIDDIFSVVADHCNGMNLYNAYLVPITDFMKVLNSSRVKEDGTEQTMKDLIEQAYGKDMLTYIMNLMKDINGIKADNRGGLEGLMNKALGRAKKTAVFGNIRVALQQPTAIVRALAEMDVKYFTPLINVAPEKGIKEEMYKYCPIAQWKSWGYYDTYMGRDIEDVMMNNWSKMDVALSGIYGELDNWTWSLIWRAVKAETKAKHPEMDTKSEEFLQLCGRRASDVFDKTQVVDSTFHRSDAMRSKQVAVKLFTAFMAEPTLTLNVFRAGCYNASEEAKAGRIGKAMKIFNRAISVVVLQAAVVSAAQAFADAWRGKDSGWPWGDDDDDDEEKAGYWLRWQRNFLYNLFDQLHLENNMYLIKDITPYINYMISQAADYLDWNPTLRAVMGWDQDYLYSQNNLIFAGLENTANGVAQLFKKLEKGDEYVDYKTKEPKAWYDIIQKIMSGIGTFIGFPAGTLMRDFRPIFMKLFPAVFAADSQLEETLTERFGKGRDGSKKSKDKEETKETSDKDEASDNETLKKLAEKAEKKAAGLSGDERNAMLWDVMSEGYTKHLDEADMDYIEHLELEFMNNGGDLDYFYEKLKQQLPSAYKKTLDDNMTDEDVANQWRMYMKMKQLGFTDEEVSDMCYRSYKAKDLKAALRMNNPQFIQDELSVLVQAGLSEQDFAKLYKYRNSGAKTYSGKYSDEKYKKSTGTYVWPAQGPITSEFGYRNAPTAGASTNHPAIDIGAAYGSPVCAADGGTIISVGWNGGYGNQIAIRHDNGTITYYSHLSGFNVNEGDTVTQGTQIGQVGSTGNSTGPHLDFKVEVNGEPVNPLQYLNTANAEYALDA